MLTAETLQAFNFTLTGAVPVSFISMPNVTSPIKDLIALAAARVILSGISIVHSWLTLCTPESNSYEKLSQGTASFRTQKTLQSNKHCMCFFY
jgi:hypothetical protein